MTDDLDAWLDDQLPRSAGRLLSCISACDLQKARPGFGQVVVPRRGSILASRVPGSYDPAPDYFFHWFRDAALIADALRWLLALPAWQERAAAAMHDFLAFNASLAGDQPGLLRPRPGWRDAVASTHLQYLRPDAEIDSVRGAQLWADSRVNADGSVDISRWSRPQSDGPALRAITLARWLRDGLLAPPDREIAAQLLREDLAFVRDRILRPSYDIWEEELGWHFYNLRVGLAAIDFAADERLTPWLATRHDCHDDAALQAALTNRLEAFCRQDGSGVCSRELAGAGSSTKADDIAVILAAIHVWDGAAATPPRLACHDIRLQNHLTRLERLFDAAYAINHHRPPGIGVAMGRYPGDVYYAGGAYHFSTLGAAEFCYRAALGDQSASWLARGDAFLRAVRRYTGEDGSLPEQFDQRDGKPTSSPDLGWCHAGLLSCAAARALAQRNIAGADGIG